MWRTLRTLAGELLRIGQDWGHQRWQAWQLQCRQALARERQRLFEALALLCLGLLACAIGLGGLLVLAWLVLPPEARVPVLAAALVILSAGGLALVWAARQRVSR